MVNRREQTDDEDSVDEDATDDDPLERDQDSSESLDVLPCPSCGQDVSELAEWCPHCQSAISSDESRRPRRSRWIVVTALLLMLAFALAVLRW